MGEEAKFACPDDAVEVGCITGAWGIKGWVRVLPHSGTPLALLSTKHWYLKPPADLGNLSPTSTENTFPRRLTVVKSRVHGDAVVAQVQSVLERNTAETLRGARVFVARENFPPLTADEYYWVDLIGLTVVNRQGESLGTVVGLIDTGPHSVLRLARETVPVGTRAQEVERLIPFVAAYVDSVNPSERRICVDWGSDY